MILTPQPRSSPPPFLPPSTPRSQSWRLGLHLAQVRLDPFGGSSERATGTRVREGSDLRVRRGHHGPRPRLATHGGKGPSRTDRRLPWGQKGVAAVAGVSVVVTVAVRVPLVEVVPTPRGPPNPHPPLVGEPQADTDLDSKLTGGGSGPDTVTVGLLVGLPRPRREPVPRLPPRHVQVDAPVAGQVTLVILLRPPGRPRTSRPGPPPPPTSRPTHGGPGRPWWWKGDRETGVSVFPVLSLMPL